MRNPLHILVENEEVPLEAIKQFYVDVELEEHKLDTVCDIYEVSLTIYIYIYAGTFHHCTLLTVFIFYIGSVS